MELDTRTLIVVLSVSNILMGCTLLWVIDEGYEEGVGLWIVSLFMKGAGTGVLLFPNALPAIVITYVAPLVLTGAYTLNYLALCAFFHVRRNGWLAYAPVAAAALLMALVGQEPFRAIVIGDVTRSLLIAVVIALLLRRGRLREDRAQRLVLVGFLLALLVFVERVVANVADPANFTDFDRSSFGRSVTFLVAFTVSILTSFGLVLMYRNRTTGRLLASENISRKHRAIVESSDDAIISKTLTGVIESWNPGAERMFGYTEQEALGKSSQLLIPDERADEERDNLSKIAQGGTVSHFETVRRRKDGGLIDVSVTISPIRDAGGRIVGASKIARDISTRKRNEAELDSHRNHLEELVRVRTVELEAARDAAEAASRAKSAFLANMSHELRTPLNGIMGMTGLALRRATDPRSIDFLEKAQAASKHLLMILGDILDVARIGAGRVEIASVPFTVREALERTAGMLGPEASTKGLRLALEVAPALGDAPLAGDPLRLGQILLDLAGNAVKFTAAGTVTLRAAVAEDRVADMLVRFEVEDTGVGIAEPDQKRLFEPFGQLDMSSTRRHGGTGLGLFIARSLVEIMGGRIGVHSSPGVGSTFWFTARFGKSADQVGAPGAGGGQDGVAPARR